MITAKTERNRKMFSPTCYQESFRNFGITSNDPWFLPAEDQDRRYFALWSELNSLLNHPFYVKAFPNPDPKERIADYFTALTASLMDNDQAGLKTLA